MPKKTREEKKLSEYRKKMMLLHQLANKPSSPELKQTTQIKNIEVEKEIQPKTNKKNFGSRVEPPKNYFMQDLKKSLIFIGIIITLEIIIYFASMNRYFLK